MKTTAEMIKCLTGRDNTLAYDCFKRLIGLSETSNEVYANFGAFVEMMESDNSYIRTRGLLLIAANARWDEDCRVDEIIDAYLKHLQDAKPITARQCIQAVAQIAKAKPDLRRDVALALRQVNPLRYQSTMQPLIRGDVAAALEQIQAMETEQ